MITSPKQTGARVMMHWGYGQAKDSRSSSLRDGRCLITELWIEIFRRGERRSQLSTYRPQRAERRQETVESVLLAERNDAILLKQLQL
jgi:hypothetical protein